MNELGKALIIFGLAMTAVGALLWSGMGRWIGRLPGDLHFSRGEASFHFPIVTCLIFSALVTLISLFFRR